MTKPAVSASASTSAGLVSLNPPPPSLGQVGLPNRPADAHGTPRKPVIPAGGGGPETGGPRVLAEVVEPQRAWGCSMRARGSRGRAGGRRSVPAAPLARPVVTNSTRGSRGRKAEGRAVAPVSWVAASTNGGVEVEVGRDRGHRLQQRAWTPAACAGRWVPPVSAPEQAESARYIDRAGYRGSVGPAGRGRGPHELPMRRPVISDQRSGRGACGRQPPTAAGSQVARMCSTPPGR